MGRHGNSSTFFSSLDSCLNENYSLENYTYSTRSRVVGQTRKRVKVERELVPCVFAHLRSTLGKERRTVLRVLLDSGASSSIIAKSHASKLRTKKSPSVEWTTAAGSFTTNSKVKIDFQLPELSTSADIQCTVNVHNGSLGTYDMILGRDMLKELGIDTCFSDQTIKWPRVNGEIPMKPADGNEETSFFVNDPSDVTAETERMSKILEAKYSKADLGEIVRKIETIDEEQKSRLTSLLRKHESLFDGTLGRWAGDPYEIQLKDGVKPYHAKPFPVPKAYEQTLKDEVERLCKIGVLKRVNRSEWAAPSFIIPKKDKTVRFINDFRELNKRIRRTPYPIPKISDMLMKLEGFQWATSLDLNMGYYHVRLSPDSAKLCTLIFPWGKYEMQSLPMGLCNGPDVFQEKMALLMDGLSYVRTYIDDLLVLTNGSLEDHLSKLDEVLKRMREAGLKVNANKSFFCQTQLEYLGYWITREGIQPLPKKVEAIQKIATPKNKGELRSFIGLVNYYRDSWIRRSDLLAPLAKLTGKSSEWRWTEAEQKAFDTIKRVVAREVLLAHPDFTKKFDIHTDASKYQLGAVISQNGKPIAFYSRKLNSAQLNYTTTERELLAIVETLKEFRSILLGQDITVYTDHKNLTYKVFNTDRVMRWRLICEEYGPKLEYIKGQKNVVADALSRLDLEPPVESECDPTVLEHPTTRALAEAFGHTRDEEHESDIPVSFKLIQKEQQTDKSLLQKARKSDKYQIHSFRGGGKDRHLVCYQDKICVPKRLQKRVVEWYHEHLVHPGETRTTLTIGQHFTWEGLRQTVHKVCSVCDRCQRTKKSSVKYGKLQEKEAEIVPWETLCVDMIGPYQIKRKGKTTLELWAVTMIDPATSWFEIAAVKTKRADVVSNVIEQTWLSRYPWPQKVITDRGTEFMAEFLTMMQEDYGVKKKPITARNPQANSIVERVHQTIGNMIRTFSVQDMDLDEDDPWSGILSAVGFAIRATVHTTLQATPSQLVFGRDAVLSIPHIANWRYIKDRKQSIIRQNNQRENAKRKDYVFKVNDLVLIKQAQTTKYGTDQFRGPYPIVSINDNGTLRVREGSTLVDTYNVRQVAPYRQ